jgi:hypothetical protein
VGQDIVLTKHGLGRWRVGLAGAVAAIVFAVSGCASIESLFSPPPPPPAKKEPAPAPVKKEPEPAPAKKEPPPPPPPTKEPEPAAPKKEPPAPPVKKEPVAPAPAKKEPPPPKKEPEAPGAKKEPEAPSIKKEPEVAPPVLAPQVGKQDEEQLRREAGTRIQRAELLLGRIDEKKLTKDQQEQFLTIQSLLKSAKEAVESPDLTRASNLAEKARILAEELAQATR